MPTQRVTEAPDVAKLPAGSRLGQPSGPGELHPGGFGAVPVVLMRDERADAWDIALYAAISGAVSFRTGVGEIRMKRLTDRSRMGKGSVLLHRRHLVELGYLTYREQEGTASVYCLVATLGDGEAHLKDQREDEEYLDPGVTGQRGGKARGKGSKGRASARVGPSDSRPLRGASKGRSRGGQGAVKGRSASRPTPQSSSSEIDPQNQSSEQATYRAPSSRADFSNEEQKTSTPGGEGEGASNGGDEEARWGLVGPDWRPESWPADESFVVPLRAHLREQMASEAEAELVADHLGPRIKVGRVRPSAEVVEEELCKIRGDHGCEGFHEREAPAGASEGWRA